MPLSYRQLGNLFTAGENINIYPSGNSYAISASSTGSGSGSIVSGTNVGTGNSFFTGLSTTTNPNDTLAFRNILAGDNITVAISTENDGNILISRGPSILVNQISPDGTITQPTDVGARFLSSITTTRLLAARTVTATNNGITSSNPASPSILLLRPTNVTASKLYFNNESSTLETSTAFNIDNTIGSLGINQTVVTGTRLVIASHAANYSAFRLTPFAIAYTGVTNGDIWYTSSGNLKFNKGAGATTDFIFKDNNNSLTGVSTSILIADTAGTLSTKYVNSFGIFNALSSVTISNTTSETSTISSQITGSTTLLASTSQFNPELGVGRKYRFNAKGTISVQNVDTTLNIRIKLGSIIISSSSTITILGSINPYDGDIEIDSTFTVRNSDLIIGSGKIVFPTGPPSTIGGDPIIFGIYSQNQTITTTVNQVFDCTAQFDVADSGSSIIIDESTLEILN